MKSEQLQIAVCYVGTSLLAPLREAEREINREYGLDLHVAAYNFGAPLDADEWAQAERDLQEADLVFVIHVMDGENAARLLSALEKYQSRHHAVVVINCMPELMRRTRMGRLDFGRMFRFAKGEGDAETRGRGDGGERRSVLKIWLEESGRGWASRRVRMRKRASVITRSI